MASTIRTVSDEFLASYLSEYVSAHDYPSQLNNTGPTRPEPQVCADVFMGFPGNFTDEIQQSEQTPIHTADWIGQAPATIVPWLLHVPTPTTDWVEQAISTEHTPAASLSSNLQTTPVSQQPALTNPETQMQAQRPQIQVSQPRRKRNTEASSRPRGITKRKVKIAETHFINGELRTTQRMVTEAYAAAAAENSKVRRLTNASRPGLVPGLRQKKYKQRCLTCRHPKDDCECPSGYQA